MKCNNLLKLLIILLIISIIIYLKDYIFIVIFNIKELLMPFLIGIVVAFIFNPLVNKIESKLKSRLLSVISLIIMLLIVLYLFILIIVPILQLQLSNIIKDLPIIINNLDALLKRVLSSISFLPTNFSTSNIDIISLITDYIQNEQTINLITHILYDSIELIVITPLFTIYLLHDFNKIKDFIKKKLIKKEKLSNFLSKTNTDMYAYLKTISIVTTIMSIISSIVFALIGLPNFLLFGIIIGITNIIPIFGSYIGGSIASLYAISISSNLLIVVIVCIILIQILESSIITPLLQGNTFKIHPLFIIVSFSIFGFLFGFWGVLLSIPLLIIIKNFITEYKKKKTFH